MMKALVVAMVGAIAWTWIIGLLGMLLHLSPSWLVLCLILAGLSGAVVAAVCFRR